MDSDSADDAAFDDADFTLADNSNTSYFMYTASARHAVDDKSCRFVSSALNSLATTHL